MTTFGNSLLLFSQTLGIFRCATVLHSGRCSRRSATRQQTATKGCAVSRTPDLSARDRFLVIKGPAILWDTPRMVRMCGGVERLTGVEGGLRERGKFGKWYREVLCVDNHRTRGKKQIFGCHGTCHPMGQTSNSVSGWLAG